MSIRSQQQITLAFSTPLANGASANATVGPAGVLLVNGVASVAVVTIVGTTTGVYTAAFTLPTLFIGDVVQLQISATTNATAEKKIVWTDSVDLSLDDSGRVNVGKVNDSATAAAVFGALGALGFTGNSSQPPTGKDFAFNDDLNNPAPTPLAGWLIFYVGEPRRVLTYDVATLSGTTDRPFTTAMEGGNALIVLPSYGPSPTTAENAAATVAALAGSIEVDVLNPTDTDGTTTIVAGDAYTNGSLLDRRLTYTVTGFTGNISGATVRWKAVRRSHYDRDDSAAAELTVTTGAVTLSAGVLTFKVPLTATQTAALQNTVINTSAANYKIAVALLSGSDVLTEVLADAYVLKRIG